MDINLDADRDYILYVGRIDFSGYNLLSDLLEERTRSESCSRGCLILATAGGDADAAYRIARALGHHYPSEFQLFVPDICKSAGTLIAIGASELIISDRGELGPLDVQIKKKEELFEASSGLDIMQSLVMIQNQVKAAFRDYLIDIRVGGGLGTKMSAQLSSEMACKLVSPIASQIDPMRLGEHQRALQVAFNYGERLIKKFNNIDIAQIETLLTGYPSHSFVIDRKEARELFKQVRAPGEQESKLEVWLRQQTGGFSIEHTPTVVCVSELLRERHSQTPEVSNEQQVVDTQAVGTEHAELVGEAVHEGQPGQRENQQD